MFDAPDTLDVPPEPKGWVFMDGFKAVEALDLGLANVLYAFCGALHWANEWLKVFSPRF